MSGCITSDKKDYSVLFEDCQEYSDVYLYLEKEEELVLEGRVRDIAPKDLRKRDYEYDLGSHTGQLGTRSAPGSTEGTARFTLDVSYRGRWNKRADCPA